jgi:hypothetical protein
VHGIAPHACYGASVAWPLSLVRTHEAVASELAPRASEATVHVRESVMDVILNTYGTRVSKNVAMKVPAFTRAYKLFTHTISCFPLREYVDGAGVTPRPFLANPSIQTTYPSLMARTVGDLICEDVAFWKVTARAWDGYPASVVWMPAEQVQVTPNNPAETVTPLPLGSVLWNGVPVPGRDVIRFDGDGTGGWLSTGVNAVNLAAALLATVVNTAEIPAPSVILKNSGADLTSDQVDALLTAWEDARANRTTAYLNSTLEAESLAGYSPNDLQLVESRNAAATDLARNSNLDPVWLGAGVPGSSLTYQNRVDLRKDLVDLALGAPMAWITARLSAPDVTPRGHTVGFDTDAFLRANTGDLAEIITKLHPIDVVTTDEARALLDFGGQTP